MKENKSQWYATAFLQDDWSINKQFSVNSGTPLRLSREIRYQPHSQSFVMYKIFPFTVRFNYARGYRSPSIKELYMNWDHLGMFWIYGNSKLKPETNNYISLSGEYVNSWININANVYSNWFRNKIEGMWSNDQTELHYINIGKAAWQSRDHVQNTNKQTYQCAWSIQLSVHKQRCGWSPIELFQSTFR